MSDGPLISAAMLGRAKLEDVERLARALKVDMADRASWLSRSDSEHREWRAVIGGRVHDAICAMALRDHVAARNAKKTATAATRRKR